LFTCDKLPEEFCQALKKNDNEAKALEIKDRDHVSIIVNMAHEDDPATQALIQFIAAHSGLKLPSKENR
jgi:hypothetical protein